MKEKDHPIFHPRRRWLTNFLFTSYPRFVSIFARTKKENEEINKILNGSTFVRTFHKKGGKRGGKGVVEGTVKGGESTTQKMGATGGGWASRYAKGWRVGDSRGCTENVDPSSPNPPPSLPGWVTFHCTPAAPPTFPTIYLYTRPILIFSLSFRDQPSNNSFDNLSTEWRMRIERDPRWRTAEANFRGTTATCFREGMKETRHARLIHERIVYVHVTSRFRVKISFIAISFPFPFFFFYGKAKFRLLRSDDSRQLEFLETRPHSQDRSLPRIEKNPSDGFFLPPSRSMYNFTYLLLTFGEI